MIIIENRRKKRIDILKKYPESIIIDVTSKSDSKFQKLSPFYPIGNIPIPNSNGLTSQSVEGIWQGLKVFENSNIDISRFSNSTMRNLKRTVKSFGKPLGHRYGINDSKILGYIEARIKIFIPAYIWVLNNKLHLLIDELKNLSSKKDLILLDYEINDDIINPLKPLSHAFIIKCYLENNLPNTEELMELFEKHKNDYKYLKKEINNNNANPTKSFNNQFTLFN